jgi:hypothetical protein
LVLRIVIVFAHSERWMAYATQRLEGSWPIPWQSSIEIRKYQ